MRMLLILFLLSNSLQGTTQSNLHFRIQKLGKGIYAAISQPGGYSICNAGIINLGKETLVFDPFMVPEAAIALKEEAERLTGNPVRYVVLSHFHNDHIGGTQVFRNAVVVSTVKTKALMQSKLPQQIAYFKNAAPDELKSYRKQYETASNEFQKTEAALWVAYNEAVTRSYDSIQMRYPDETFETENNIRGTKRTVQLLSYGSAHTPSDCFLYLPEEKIAFCGDLLFMNHHPWLGDGNIEAWKQYLLQLKKLPALKYVSGHGNVGNKKNLDTMHRYLETIQKTAKDFIKDGISPGEGSPPCPASPFEYWQLSEFYFPNLMQEYKRQKTTQQEKINRD